MPKKLFSFFKPYVILLIFLAPFTACRFNANLVEDEGTSSGSIIDSTPTPIPAPTVTIVTPVSASTMGGVNITITGTGFLAGATVTLGGVSCNNISVTNSTSITCTTQAHAAGAVDIIVTNADSQSGTRIGAFTYAVIAGLPNSWTETTTTGAPSARGYLRAIWTGTKMIVFGGLFGADLNTGGVYDPVTNSWTPTQTMNAPESRIDHTVVWTGTKMIVFGGQNVNGTPYSINTGGIYDPTANSWTAVSTTDAPSTRDAFTSVWTGTKMLVFGGYDETTGLLNNTGGLYDPNTNLWSTTETTDAPEERSGHTAVWSGTKMIIFGGENSAYNKVNTGGLYNPTTNQWTSTNSINAPTTRIDHCATWTGSKMITFGGGTDGTINLNSGGSYDPGTNLWTALATNDAPIIRVSHTCVWTGDKMIVWGGWNTSALNDGGIYDPIANSWTATQTTNAPTIRAYFSAVWTGTNMIIFGGYTPFLNWRNTGGIYTP